MDKYFAKIIAEKITNKQLKDMFDSAKNNITDWTKISCVNKYMTKGTSWNILAKDFNVETKYGLLVKTNMIREFGEFLPQEFVDQYKTTPQKKINIPPIHQEPIF